VSGDFEVGSKYDSTGSEVNCVYVCYLAGVCSSSWSCGCSEVNCVYVCYLAGVCSSSWSCGCGSGGCSSSVTRRLSAARSNNDGCTVGHCRPRETSSHSTTARLVTTCPQVPATRTGRPGHPGLWESRGRPVHLCTSPLSDDEECAEAYDWVPEGQSL